MATYAGDHKADWKTLHLVIYEENYFFSTFVLLYLFVTGFVLLNASLCYKFGVNIVFIHLKTILNICNHLKYFLELPS